jgi:U3 small nucleolar RNA-associated protein 11
MINSQVDKAGRKVSDRGNKSLSVDVVKLLKTQDAGYIRTMLQMVRKERKELEQRIVLETEGGVRTLKDEYEDDEKEGKTVFVQDREEQSGFNEDAWFGKGGELPGRKQQDAQELYEDGETQSKKKLSKKQQEAKLLVEKEERNLLRNRERTQERMVIRLSAVKARERDLMIAEEELEHQRAKMAHTTGGVNKNGVKFKIRERKR